MVRLNIKTSVKKIVHINIAVLFVLTTFLSSGFMLIIQYEQAGAIAVRGTSTGFVADATSAFTVTTPSSTVSGDLLLLFMHHGRGDIDIESDWGQSGSNWTFIRAEALDPGTSNESSSAWHRTATSGDAGGSGSYNFTVSVGVDALRWVVVAVQDHNGFDTSEGYNDTDVTTSPSVSDSITPTEDGALLLAFLTKDDNDGQTSASWSSVQTMTTEESHNNEGSVMYTSVFSETLSGTSAVTRDFNLTGTNIDGTAKQIMVTINPPTVPTSDKTVPYLTQEGYIFENDDGINADSNSQQAAGNTSIEGVRKGEMVNLRMQLSNSEAPLDSELGLFYQKDDGFWTQVKHGAASDYGGSDCNDTDWYCDIIDNAMGHTRGFDAAIDPSTGLPWAIWEAIDGDLTVGRYVGINANGACRGGNNKWSCEEIDINLGKQASIAIDSSGKAWVSYGGGSQNLWIAEFVGSGGTGCSAGTTAWTCTQIYSGDMESTSVVIDDTGKVWVSAVNETAGDVVVAELVGTGGSGCISGTVWNCVVVDDDVGTTGRGSSTTVIVLDDAGNPNIVYEDDSGVDAELVHAEYVGSSGTGCTSSAWTCTNIALDSSRATWLDAALAPDGTIWVSYSPESSGDLVVANFVGSGGNCDTTKSGSDAWECTDVDTSGTDTGEGTSISFDPGGQAFVSYLDDAEGALRYARYVGSGGSGCSDSAWDGCSIIFDDASTNGRYTATVFDPSGKTWAFFTSPGSNDLQIAVKKMNQYITPANSNVSNGLSSLTESHIDMTSVTDSTNRDDADCVSAGGNWNNGLYTSNALTNLTLSDGADTIQCSEVTFGISTGNAEDGTYKFALAFRDRTKSSKSFWRSVAQIDEYPTMGVIDEPGIRFSKGTTPIFSDCAGGNGEWGCDTVLFDATGAGAGRYPSPIIDDEGVAWIGNLIDSGSTDEFLVAKYVGSGGNCDTIADSGSDRWECEVVYDAVSSQDGAYSSSAINPLTGKPSFVFASDVEVDTNIIIAEYVGSGGTGCTGGTSAFKCTEIVADQGNGFGEGTTIQYSASGIAYVAYRQSTGGDIWFSKYVGSGGNCDDDYNGSDAWSCDEIVTTDLVGNSIRMVIDKDGIPWIVTGITTGTDSVFAVKYVGSGGSNCGNDAWDCTRIDNANFTTATESVYSITVDDNNSVWVSYHEDSLAEGRLFVAQYVGSGGTGCTDSAWTCTLVEGVAGDEIGDRVSMVTGKDGNPIVVYGNSKVPGTFNDVRIARYVGAGGTGCDSASWDGCEVVWAKNGNTRDLMITIEDNGLILGAVRDESSDNLSMFKQHFWDETLYTTNSNVSQNANVANAADLAFLVTDGRSARSLDNGDCGSGLANLLGYCGMLENDGSFDSITAAANERPFYGATIGFTTNTEMPLVSWVGRTDVAPNTSGDAGDIRLEIYRYGSTNAWEALATDTTSSNCDTVDCELSGSSSGPPSEYFRLEDGVYWFAVRLYQVESSSSMTLRTDELSATITGQRLRTGRTFEGGAPRPFVTE